MSGLRRPIWHGADWAGVARDYLGPQAHASLARMAPPTRAASFGSAWTRLEASLKCLDLALTEWTPMLESQLRSCRVRALALPPGYCGAMATRRAGPAR